MGRKLGGCASLGEEELGPHLTQCGQGRDLPACQASPNPSNSLATTDQRHRQTGQGRQTTVW